MPATMERTMPKPKKPVAVEPEPKPTAIQIRVSPEYKAWAESFAVKEGDTLSRLFDRGVRKLAKEAGFPDPPVR